MYRELKNYEGQVIGEVERSITINRPLPQLKDFLLSVDHVNDVLGQNFDIEADSKGSFSWSFDGPLALDYSGRGTVTSSTPTTVVWKAQDTDNRGLELKLELQRAGNGTKVKMNCLFDHPGTIITTFIQQMIGGGPDGLARKLLDQLKQLAEAEPREIAVLP